MQRPAGVTILAVLNYLAGASLFVGSMFGLFALSSCTCCDRR